MLFQYNTCHSTSLN